MTKKTSSSSASAKSGKVSGRTTKVFSRFIASTIVFLLAIYGCHSILAENVPVYKSFVNNCIKSVVTGVASVEKKLAPHPEIIIKNHADWSKNPYDNLFYGVPTYKCDVIVDRIGYALGYSEKHEQPLWVSYKLTAEEVKSKLAKRSGDFRSDPAIPTISAAPEDYAGSAYDRGHLAPAADMSFSIQAMSESFFMSNMSPQRPGFNRGIWKKLESKVRDYAAANHAIYVVTGPVFSTKNDQDITVIGANKVTVPDAYYKVVLDANSVNPKAIGFILPNYESKKTLESFAVTVDAVENLTGLDFFAQLPDDVENFGKALCLKINRTKKLPENAVKKAPPVQAKSDLVAF